ncbi:hypothetical protein LTR53_000213 [Teratosphaeriaceae sp. CCFEE 6253]|nr:hypothetical protein LTR53_000213 [Teratosphaeriaceae sp. CCFEE 6253]
MADNAELQAKIAAISGKINQQRHQPYQPPPQPHHVRHQSASHGDARWSPYGRGGKTPVVHKNRTLVLNGTSTPPSANPGSPSVGSDSPALVSTRSINNQLMTKDTYEREQKQKIEHTSQRRAVKRQKRNTQDQHRILSHLESTGDGTSREMTVEGIRFLLAPDGSKLTRVPGEPWSHDRCTNAGALRETDTTTYDGATPKKATVVGVDFVRTKGGNLVRASALKAPIRPTSTKPQCETFTKHGSYPYLPDRAGHPRRNASGGHHGFRAATRPSHSLLTVHLGTCPYGPRCHFAHDPDKVAICKDFLRNGTCALGDNCDMSHEMTYHRVSACQFFIRGNCTNNACRYPHVLVSPAASVCRAFATLGFCAKGPDCDKRHVHECPDYANSGYCANRESGKCGLPHPERASTLRKAVKRQSKTGSEAESDISSDEEDKVESMDDIDSEAEDALMAGFDDELHELSQQHDFVGFR